MNRRLQQFLSVENISQSLFAETLGVAKSNISHILSGRNKPGSDFLISMVEHYPTLNIEWLLTGKGRMYKDNYKNSLVQEEKKEEENLFESEISSSPRELNIPEQSVQEPANTKTSKGYNNMEIIEPKIKDDRKITKVVVFFDDNTFQELV